MCVSEAFCPNIQPRAHARLTGLTKNCITVFSTSRSRDQCAANRCTIFDCSLDLGLGFGDGLGLWLSSGHLLLSGDGLGFWVMVLE